nr:DUF4837 family protein [Myroides oncorhynchi]
MFSLFVSCKDRTANDIGTNHTEESSQILVVINDRLWYGAVGDSIREYLAEPIEGISPPESKFFIEQISPNLFSSRTKNRRNIIVFSDNYNKNSFQFEQNKFTDLQMYFSVSGESKIGLINEFKKNVDSITNSILNSEFDVITKRISRGSIIDPNYFQDKFKVHLTLPSTYKLVSNHNRFVWYKKDIASGNSNVLIYDIPLSRIENNKNTIANNLLFVKDSVNGMYIHSIEDNSFMSPNEGSIPIKRESTKQGRKVYEFTGDWDMQNSFMSGPYLSYAIRDVKTNRYLFIEGLVYNPSMGKRSILMEVEAIINTLSFNDN